MGKKKLNIEIIPLSKKDREAISSLVPVNRKKLKKETFNSSRKKYQQQRDGTINQVQ